MMAKTGEEWATKCRFAGHQPEHDAERPVDRLCLDCARAYAAKQRREVVEQAARICDAEFRWSTDGRVFTTIPGSDRVAALIRALAGDVQEHIGWEP